MYVQKQSIAAVVVTYNRVNLLKQVIKALDGQTRQVDEIIVVNNCSTDGTAKWLSGQQHLTVINQGNLGGAGGQNAGIRRAYERGHDWIWCMDDDGRPHVDALENFERTQCIELEKYGVMNAAVYHSDEPQAGCISLSQIVAKSDRASFELIGAQMFNGTFISREAYEKIGNVISELFIWGDEVNYFMRSVRAYGAVPVLLRCLHYHPRTSLDISTPTWKQYYHVRNAVFNAKTLSRFGKIGVAYVIGNLAMRSFRGLIRPRVLIVGIRDGLSGRLGIRHNAYGLH